LTKSVSLCHSVLRISILCSGRLLWVDHWLSPLLFIVFTTGCERLCHLVCSSLWVGVVADKVWVYSLWKLAFSLLIHVLLLCHTLALIGSWLDFEQLDWLCRFFEVDKSWGETFQDKRFRKV
jgi:hypothetical protein